MKTPRMPQSPAARGVALGFAFTSLAILGCGADHKGDHFPGKKYGMGDATAQNADDPVVTPDDQSEGGAADYSTSGSGATAPTGSGAASGSGSVVVSADGSDTEDGKLAPGALIKNIGMQSYFDLNSAIGIKNGRGDKSLGLAATKVKANLTSAPGDGMILSNTYGDGVARSVSGQNIVNSAGDANRMPGAPSASMVQMLYRVNSDQCPGVLLCIEKLVSIPVEGDPFTVCFKDAATGKPAIFPYGALPNYKGKDFAGAYKDYGPYTVTAYAGKDVDCSDVAAAPLATETLAVTVSAVDITTIPFKLHNLSPLKPSFAVKLDRHRTVNDDTAPYADETVGLNKSTTYVISEDASEIVQLVVTKRQSIDVGAQAGGGILGGIAGVLVGIDGVKVDLHFEMCDDLLKPALASHCPEVLTR